MGNVNMEAKQVHVRDNNKKNWRTVSDALKALEESGESVAEDITELYTRDASRANKDDIANEFSAEQAYYTGDFVYYQGSLFKFIANHAAGAWNPEDVAPEQIGQDIVTLKSGLTNLDNEVNGDATTYPYADVITIPNAVPSNLADCSVKIEPVQSGSGDPSPENVRPITGHTEASVTVVDDVENPTVTKTYTIALRDTIYGGTVDFDTGVMTVDRSYQDMSAKTYYVVSGTTGTFATNTALNGIKAPASNDDIANIICTDYKTVAKNDQTDCCISVATSGRAVICDSHYDGYTAGDFQSAMSGVYACFELETPSTVQLTPTQIQLLKGTNTITASTGKISVTANGVSGAIGAVQTQANATDEALEELAADIAEQLPTAPTTDGAYVLTVTVADGTPTYSWESAT